MKSENATKTQQHLFDRISFSVLRIIAGVLIGMQFFVPMIYTYININHDTVSFAETPEDYNLKYSNIEFKTDDGSVLRGWFVPAEGFDKSPGILLVHGLGTNRSDLLDIATIFNKNGYSSLLFDLRAHGLSDGGETTFGIKEVSDIREAFRALSQQKYVDETKLGIYAVSMGASFSIVSASKEDFVKEHLKAMFLDSPYSKLENVLVNRFPYTRGYITPLSVFVSKMFSTLLLGENPLNFEPIDSIRDVEVPIYLVHGSEDRTIPVLESEYLFNNKPIGLKDLWIAPLSDHLQAHRDYQEEYEERLIKFFDSSLKSKILN